MLPIPKVEMHRRFNIVTLCDAHAPYADEDALSIAFEVCKILQPPIIVTHEWHDFYSLSRFCKDPNRITSLQEELDKVVYYYSELRDRCPDSRILLLHSNHLERLKKYLWSQAPALNNIRSLQLENLLELKKNNIELLETFDYNGVLFKHGDIVRKHSAYTCRAEFEKEGMSGVSGHTHRVGKYSTRKRGGRYTWVEAGCLCQLDPEYIEGTADWQQGMAITSFRDGHDSFYSIPLEIINHKLLWGKRTIAV